MDKLEWAVNWQLCDWFWLIFFLWPKAECLINSEDIKTLTNPTKTILALLETQRAVTNQKTRDSEKGMSSLLKGLVLGIYVSFDIADQSSTQKNFGYLGPHSDCPTFSYGPRDENILLMDLKDPGIPEQIHASAPQLWGDTS